MTSAELQQAIRSQQLPNLLYLYGQEGFLVEKAMLQVRRAVVAADAEDFNFQQFFGKEATAEDIIEAARTLPVFAPRRLVLVKDAHQLSAAVLEGLQPYLKDPVAETCLLFCGDKIDSRRKFFQLFKKQGSLVEFKPLYDNQVPGFVKEQVQSNGCQITEDALNLFCARVGTNLQEVQAELEKLRLFLGERDLIDVADVEAIVSDTRSENVFELANAVGKGELGQAFTLVKRLVEEGEAPLKVLSLLVRHYRQLWKARELQVQGRGNREIAKQVGLHPYFVEGMIRQAKRFSRRDFQSAFDLFLETDLAMKSSGADAEALLERLLLRLVTERQH